MASMMTCGSFHSRATAAPTSAWATSMTSTRSRGVRPWSSAVNTPSRTARPRSCSNPARKAPEARPDSIQGPGRGVRGDRRTMARAMWATCTLCCASARRAPASLPRKMCDSATACCTTSRRLSMPRRMTAARRLSTERPTPYRGELATRSTAAASWGSRSRTRIMSSGRASGRCDTLSASSADSGSAGIRNDRSRRPWNWRTRQRAATNTRGRTRSGWACGSCADWSTSPPSSTGHAP